MLENLFKSVLCEDLKRVSIERYLEKPWIPPESIKKEIEQKWQKMVSKAEEQGRDLFSEPGTLLRIISIEQNEENVLKLRGQPTEYKYHATTRTDQSIENRANPLYVAANILTTDNYLVYGIRGKKVERGSGQIGIIAGSVNPKEHKMKNKPSPDIAIYAEMDEETGLLQKYLLDKKLKPSFVIVDRVSKPNELYPTLIYEGKLKIDRKAVEDIFNKKKREFDELYFIEFDKSTIERELNNRSYGPREQIILNYLSINLR